MACKLLVGAGSRRRTSIIVNNPQCEYVHLNAASPSPISKGMAGTNWTPTPVQNPKIAGIGFYERLSPIPGP